MLNFILQCFVITATITYTASEFNPLICMDLPDGSKVPSPLFCNQFFVCQNGMLSDEGTCPPNMLFNPDNEECDFPQHVDCRGVPLPSEEDTDEPTNPTEATDPTDPPEPTDSAEPTDPPILTEQCPEVDSEFPVFLPVPDNCNAYILCFHGNEIRMECSAGLYWNKNTNKCDDPSNVDCVKTDEYGCPREGVHFLPHPDSCKKYIYCRDGFSRVQSCAFLHKFDPVEKTCVIGNTC
ncbi:probable chitinase 10 [Topomyia yanbarensis]|uniref:probable chitinase 10 n=1 Tax=Topomyia yanbarensis TaxID=2498891 RepID=UPI00273C824F|nr:probable chitinase 10 [Topomyia yanbarensis]